MGGSSLLLDFLFDTLFRQNRLVINPPDYRGNDTTLFYLPPFPTYFTAFLSLSIRYAHLYGFQE